MQSISSFREDQDDAEVQGLSSWLGRRPDQAPQDEVPQDLPDQVLPRGDRRTLGISLEEGELDDDAPWFQAHWGDLGTCRGRGTGSGAAM